MDFEKASVGFILRFQIQTLVSILLCPCFQQSFKLARKSTQSPSNQMHF